MWSCQGKPVNITKPILAKTSKRGVFFSRQDTAFVTKDFHPTKIFQYAAILTDKEFTGLKFSTPSIWGIPNEHLEKLRDGDIILIEPDGRINRLYEIGANDNAILATERCNCRCIMCPQPPRNDKPGLNELNIKLISLLDRDRTRSFCITGGEPTLLGDDFISLIAECKKHLPKTPLAVLTNGKAFKDFEFTRKLVEVGHPDLILCVALYADNDSGHDEIVGIPGSFFETVKGITNLALFGQKIEIRIVICSKNYKRLPQFSEFIYRNFPFSVHIAFMGMEITGLAQKNYEQVWVDPVDYMPYLEKAIQILERGHMNVSIYNHQLCILPRSIWRYSRKSISTWKNEHLEICKSCSVLDNCGGFFSTSNGIFSRNINPVYKEFS